MIFYFSGTGNSKWIAEEMAKLTNDVALDVIKVHEIPSLEEEKQVGIVFPVYAWSPAEPILNFVKRLPKSNGFTYGIATCGQDAGLSLDIIDSLYHLDSKYSVAMPDNYIIATNIKTPEIIKKKIKDADLEVNIIAREVNTNRVANRVNEGSMAKFKSKVITKFFNKYGRRTKGFFADNKCNGCGECAEMCPCQTITIVDGKPKWGEKCYSCLACIHRCPQKAIQHGKRTQARDRYIIEEYL